MTVALVLSGGGAKGDFQIGALRFLYDQGVRPDILCGTSVGAINATKLAEGEGELRQGLAGLEAIWKSLRQNGDMYSEETWLYHPDMDPRFRDWITGRSQSLSIDAPPDERPEWGTELGWLITRAEGAAFLVTDGQALL